MTLEPRGIRYTARALSLLWACWWILFGTAGSLATGMLGQAIVSAILTVGPVVLAWKKERQGGSMLILEGVLVILLFTETWTRKLDVAGILIMFASMPVPPLIAGILFVIDSHRTSSPTPIHAH